jgi:hypothetical protein
MEVERDQAETLVDSQSPDTLASSDNEPDTQLGSTEYVGKLEHDEGELAWSTMDTEDFDTQPSRWRYVLLPLVVSLIGLMAVGIGAFIMWQSRELDQKTSPVITPAPIKVAPVTPARPNGPQMFEMIDNRDAAFWNKIQADDLPWKGDLHDALDPHPMQAIVTAHNICTDERYVFSGDTGTNAADIYKKVSKAFGWTFDQTLTLARDSIAAYCPDAEAK